MISPGLFIEGPNPFRIEGGGADPVKELFKNASREFLIAYAAGVEMESKTEQTPDGRCIFTMTTVPLVGIADLGDGRITVFTRERANVKDRKG